MFLRYVSAARQQLQQRIILLLRNHTRIEQALELRFIQTAADFGQFGLIVVPPSAFAAAQAIVMQSRVQTAAFIFVFIFVSSLSSGFILFGSRSLERCKNSTRRLNQV